MNRGVGDRARRVVECVEQRLLTPLGLRSLAPGDPGYASHYADVIRARRGLPPGHRLAVVDGGIRGRVAAGPRKHGGGSRRGSIAVCPASDGAPRAGRPRSSVGDRRCGTTVHDPRLSVSGMVARRASGAARHSGGSEDGERRAATNMKRTAPMSPTHSRDAIQFTSTIELAGAPRALFEAFFVEVYVVARAAAMIAPKVKWREKLRG